MEAHVPFLSTDRTRCTGCGLCTAVCRRFIFALSPEDGKSMVLADKAPLCMHCGQCLAVCPASAISLDGMTGENLPEDRGTVMADAQLSSLLRHRRSIGRFSRRPPGRHLIMDALADAAYAPSASNLRSVRWKIIDEPNQLESLRQELLPYYRDNRSEKARSHYQNALEGRDSLLRGAPCVILAMAPSEAPWACTDCAIAVSHLELALLARSIGACWAGSIVQVAEKHQLSSLCLPAGYKVHGALMAGYPSVRWRKVPLRSPGHILFNHDTRL